MGTGETVLAQMAEKIEVIDPRQEHGGNGHVPIEVVANMAVSQVVEPIESGPNAIPNTNNRNNGNVVSLQNRRTPEQDKNTVPSDLIKLYLKDIGKIPLLTKDQEVALAKRIKAGEEAREELVTIPNTVKETDKYQQLQKAADDGEAAKHEFAVANLRLVVSIAKKYQGQGLSLLDLIQEGSKGLMRGVEKFDGSKGFKFSTYATWWIKQAIKRGIANTGRTIRLPAHFGDQLNGLNNARAKLEAELGRPPSLSELAEETEMAEDIIAKTLFHNLPLLSLEEHLYDESDDYTLKDIVGDKYSSAGYDDVNEGVVRSGQVEFVREILSSLSEKERQVLILRKGLDGQGPKNLEDIGKFFNVTRERIRQIEAKAMAKLRDNVENNPELAKKGRELL